MGFWHDKCTKLVDMQTTLPIAGQDIDAIAPRLRRDLKTVATFIELYCQCNHSTAVRDPVTLRTHDLNAITGRSISLCGDCTKLLTHAFVKRSHCVMNPKPACKHCPVQCYHPKYKAAISEVMRFSGRKMVLGGRLDYLIHLLF
jgi:hypothetical protein